MRKILLGKNKSKKSVNEINIIPIEFSRDYSLFQDENKSETFDLLKLYEDEKNNSNKHRFIFTINPICTNVLFNHCTEIIYKEGTDECLNLGDSNTVTCEGAIGNNNPTRYDAIRNTEYSNDKFHLTYHCGADIFNNHLLRKKDDISVQKISKKNSNNAKLITSPTTPDSGNDKIEISPNPDNTTPSIPSIPSTPPIPPSDINYDKKFNTIEDYSRNYIGDILKKQKTTNNYIYNLKSENENSINLYTYDTIHSFFNGFKNNVSRNNGWIGFYNPSTLHIPISGDVSANTAYYVNKCINNVEGCQFVDLCPERDLFYFTPKKNIHKHRLEYNWDYCLTYPSECVYEFGEILKGYGKGLPIDKEFSSEYVSDNGISTILLYSPITHNIKAGDIVKILFNYKGEDYERKCSVVNVGYFDKKQVEHYFSVRRDDLFYLNDDVLDNFDNIRFIKIDSGFECVYYLRKFSKFKKQPNSTINRLAFANNIYGDEISQIIFTEDLNTEDYIDNLGRPLTEIYLTVVKNNKGYEEWYKSGITSGDSIEYSHVFGNVTSGIDIKTNNKKYPVIRLQHNIDKKYIDKDSSTTIETNISVRNNDSFYGDLVEFNPKTVKETILEPIKHRFNTAQREIFVDAYSAITYDEITSETNDGNISVSKIILTGNTLNPEGYIYIPHHKVKIGYFSDFIKQKDNSKIYLDENINNIINSDNITCLTTTAEYDLMSNDNIILFSKNKQPYFYTIESYQKNNETKKWEIKLCDSVNFTRDIDIDNHIIDGKLFVYKHNKQIPEYAYMVPNKSGACLWRDLILPSNYSYGTDLYNTPFANGSFYHHENIVFPVRRQDPDKEYVLKNVDTTNNQFYIPSDEKPLTLSDDYINNNFNGLCF